MFDLVKWLLRFWYYYARATGLLNFEIDLETGRARKTLSITIYAAIVNALCFCLLPLLSSSEVINMLWTSSEALHEYMFLVILLGRVLCVSVTLIARWLQREQIIRIVNAFQRLAQQQPKVIRLWRRAVICKFLSIIVSDALQITSTTVMISESGSLKLTLSLMIFSAFEALVNVLISHYYFVLLNVHGHYILLNQELREIIAEIRSLEFEERKAVLMIKCCALADQVEQIARTQYQLQKLTNQSTSIYGLQKVLTSINYYMSAVAVVYFASSGLTGLVYVHWKNWVLILFYVEFTFYFIDVHVSMNIMYSLLDVHGEMMDLLAQNTLFACGLDVRLEVTLESLKLQLAWNPLKFPVLGLFNMDKTICISFLSSIVDSSLVLFQIDLQKAPLF